VPLALHRRPHNTTPRVSAWRVTNTTTPLLSAPPPPLLLGRRDWCHWLFIAVHITLHHVCLHGALLTLQLYGYRRHRRRCSAGDGTGATGSSSPPTYHYIFYVHLHGALLTLQLYVYRRHRRRCSPGGGTGATGSSSPSTLHYTTCVCLARY